MPRLALACRALLAAALPLVAPVRPAAAQPAAPATPAAAPAAAGAAAKVLTARRTDRAPRIDGRLDDAVWAGVPAATGFVQAVPTSGAPATERSEVRVLHDDDALYVGYRLYDAHPDSIAANIGRRDQGGLYTDWAHVAIDSYHDRRTAWRFSLNPRGLQGDGSIFDDTERDPLWDAVWQGAATIDSLGWVAEFRIPLSQLRYTLGADGAARVWGINFAREIARKGERSYWSPTPPDQPGIVSRMGRLVGLDSVPVASRLELAPYVRTQVTRTPAQPGNPLHQRHQPDAAVGVDLKYRLPRNLTLSAAVNPDFGQVEADPAVVNLSAFEVFFAERRPFFLEGADVFRFGGTVTLNDDDRPTFFYSRRLGRAPARRLGGAEARWVDAPAQTPILAAAKVSGKTPGRWSVGALGTATLRQEARLVDTLGAVGRAAVEPASGYGVLRLRRDLRGGETAIGGLATMVARELGDPAFLPLVARSATTVGLDAQHAWGNRTWTASGVVSASRVAGDVRFVERLQRANYRLYQRPDAPHVEVDGARTALTGRYTALSLAKTGGRHWIGSTTLEETTPGFELNDLGFQQRADRRTWSNSLAYREQRLGTRGLGRLFRDWEVGTYWTGARNFAGDVVANRGALAAEATFASFWSVETLLSHSRAAADDRLTRGGPVVRVPARTRGEFELATDSRRVAVGRLSLAADGDSSGRRGRSAALTVDVRPSSAVTLRVGPSWTRRTDTDQWVFATADPLATQSFGRRYVFGDIDRDELAVELRGDWALSPWLTVQLFARPFAARGRYRAFKELDRPGSFGYAEYGAARGRVERDGRRVTIDPDGPGTAPAFGFAEPDFAVRALRGNAVVRWEFRPGSALFVVWQRQGDGALDDPYRVAPTGLGRDVARAFRDPGADVLLVKVSRWIGR